MNGCEFLDQAENNIQKLKYCKHQQGIPTITSPASSIYKPLSALSSNKQPCQQASQTQGLLPEIGD
jgi:hypothetical protein